MALIKCGECGREISIKAQACPGCGAPGIAKLTGSLGCGTVVSLIFALAILWVLFGSLYAGESAEKPIDEEALREYYDSRPFFGAGHPQAEDEWVLKTVPWSEEAAECLASLRCWGKRQIAAAEKYCALALGGRIGPDARWLEGAPIFTQAEWTDSAFGVLEYSGAGLYRLVGIKERQPLRYRCIWDPEAAIAQVVVEIAS